MNDETRLIEDIIGEHANIIRDIGGVAQACDDATVINHLAQVDKDFSPGRLDQTESMRRFKDTLTRCEAGLIEHFSREETALLEVFKKHGNEEMMLQFYDLLRQHQEIRDRFAEAKSRADKLASGEISIGLWNASANDLLAYMNKTRQLIEEHAAHEEGLFRALRENVKNAE